MLKVERPLRGLVLALLPLSLLAAAACGDDGASGASPAASVTVRATDTPKAKASKSPATEEPATADGLKAAVESFTKAVYAGNSDRAYRSLDKECKDKVNKKQYAGQLANAAAVFKHDEGVELSALHVKLVEIQNVGDGQGEARVTPEADGQDFPPGAWRTWKYEEGAWRTSECTG